MDTLELERRRPYPGQRYRHGWIPIDGSVTGRFDEDFESAITESSALSGVTLNAAERFPSYGRIGSHSARDVSDAIRAYRGVYSPGGATSPKVNGSLRSAATEGRPLSPRIAEQVGRIDAAFEASEAVEPLAVWRAIDNPTAVFGDGADGDLRGIEFIDPAYTSTTASRTTTQTFTSGDKSVVMRVLIPAGHPAVAVSPSYDHDLEPGSFNEAEILLPRGSRFRVVNDTVTSAYVNGAGDPVREIDVEVLPYVPPTPAADLPVLDADEVDEGYDDQYDDDFEDWY